MDCTEYQRLLHMSDEEFQKIIDPYSTGPTTPLAQEMDDHLRNCEACQVLQAKTELALEAHNSFMIAMNTEEDVRKGFADDPELAEQIIADAKAVGHTFAKSDDDGLQRLEKAAASSPRLKSWLLGSRKSPPPSEKEVRERVKRIRAEFEESSSDGVSEDKSL